VLSAISASIDARHIGRRPLLDALKQYLQRRHLLLVLDNFEHVLAAAPIVGELLAECPALSILATSRAPLRLTWEHEFPVGPLPVPDTNLDRRPEELVACPSVALLLEGMDRVGLTGGTDPQDLVVLADICRRLEGIPLAIELAAARARLFPPRALLDRLRHPLELLTGGPRDTPARHQAIRKTFDWSYDLLADSDQRLFRNLGVFLGGCTVEAAARVTVAATAADVEFVDALERLLESSLVRRSASAPAGKEPRLVLLEPVREYALERLDASGEADDVRQRHAIVYLELAELADLELKGPRQGEWIARLEREHGNLRLALRWFIECGDVARSLRMAAALSWFWWVRGYGREGLERFSEVLSLPSPEPPNGSLAMVRARALSGAGVLLYWHGDFEAASVHTHAALELYTEAGETRGCGFALNMLGNCALAQGDLDRSELLYEQSLAAYRVAADKRGMSQTLTNLGLVAHQRKNYDRANTLLTESVSMERAAGDARGVAIALGGLGIVQCYRGEFARSEATLRESLSLWRDMPERAVLPLLLEFCAVLAVATGNRLRALRVAGAAAALRDQIEAPRPPVWTPELHRWLEIARAAAGAELSAKAWNQGLALSADEAIAEALGADATPGIGRTPESSDQTRAERESLPGGLTMREAEVLRMVAAGNTNKEIANALVLSVATVERHLANIYTKIGARGRADATAFAITRGFLGRHRS
jgi:non-specific serine/threonine protein kinase